MVNITQNQEFKIKRNLTDAGCSTSQIEQFINLVQEKKRPEQYRFLSCHKLELLKKLHENQRKVDCLDFMVYAMKKEDNENFQEVFENEYEL